MIVGSVVYGADDVVGRFVMERTGTKIERYTALGVVRGGSLIAGVIWHNYRGHDIEATIASDTPNWAFPATLRRLFAFPFVQLGVVRVTSIVSRKNKPSRRFCEGLGFRLEGVCRQGMDGKIDAMIYGCLRDECRVLRTKNG